MASIIRTPPKPDQANWPIFSHASPAAVMIPQSMGGAYSARAEATGDGGVLVADGLRNTRIVMITARGRETEVDHGLSLGADAFLTKPFSTRELMEKIRALLSAGSNPG